MSEYSMPFDAVIREGKPDRVINADKFGDYMSTFFDEGVFNLKTGMSFNNVTNNNMSVSVGVGKALINNKYYVNDSPITFNIDPADGILNRIDTIVLRKDHNKRLVTMVLVKGVPNTNPVPVPIKRETNGIYEFQLYQIRINAGATKILGRDITDMRLNKTVCGIVATSVDHIDTTTFYNQIKSDLGEFKNREQQEFLKWFNNIKEKLSTDVAANLQNQVDELRAGKLDKSTKYAASDTVGGNAKVANKTKAGLSIKLNGTSQGVFDGSAAKEININYSSTGAAPASHNHNASNINAGTMSAERLPVIPVSKGGTGATTSSPALANLGGMPKTGGTFSGKVEFSKTAVFADDTAFQQGYRLGSLATKETTCQIGKNLQSYNNVIQSLATGVHLCAQDDNYSVHLKGKSVHCMKNASETTYIPIYASAFTQQSSKRFKENIINMELSEAEKLYQLNTVSFDYINGEKDMVGLIAEEVEPLLPNVCSYGEEGGEKTLFGIDYTRFIPYLIKLAQEQKKEIDELKAEIEELKRRLIANKNS